jgi:RNA polymerase sigma-70 factor (ECF subfamily)
VTHDDRQLVAEAAAGSKAAGTELFERHCPVACRVAVSLTREPDAAEDVVQDAFERAFRGLGSFDGRSSFRTWLCRIVVNRALDVARRERPRVELAAVESLASEDGEIEAGQDVLDAVARLSLDRRAVVVLRYWGGFTPSEIAELLEVPAGTVHSRLARALAELRSHLEVPIDH